MTQPWLKLRVLAGGSLLMLSIASAAAQGARVPAPDPLQGDGRVSPFYTWEQVIPSKPGTLLRSEPLEQSVGLAQASKQYRLLFSSTDGVGGKDPITVSGALFIPKGKAPEGGWPIVAWGHGTFGGADACAHSWHARSYRDVRYLNRWLQEGYAVVASDYQGIGVPGYNPQFNNRSNSYTMLDSVRAALSSFSPLANKVLLVGQSQGGSAVVAAAGYAPIYAPDVNVRGAIGTGIVYAAGRTLQPLKPVDPNANDKVEPTLAYSFYGVLAAQALDPGIDASKIYTDRALPLLEQARTSCLAALELDVEGAGLTRANTFKPGAKEELQRDRVGDVYRKFETLKLNVPLFIGAGADDSLGPAQLALAEDTCAAGTTTEIHLYADRDHSGTVNESLRDSLPFARKAINGEPIASVCKPAPSR